jgi:glycine/D-amino acid oxidase-like deaminating enzyme
MRMDRDEARKEQAKEFEAARKVADSAVTKIEEMKGGVRVVTDGGARVTADRAIFATNAPINDRFEIHSKMAPYRTYAMAFTVARDTLPDALYWDMADPYHYIRLQPGQGPSDYPERGRRRPQSGEADYGDKRLEAIESWIRRLVPALGKEVRRWSGQVMSTIDHCATSAAIRAATASSSRPAIRARASVGPGRCLISMSRV